MRKIPKKLRKDPIVEAVFELRFKPAPSAPSAFGDVLAGILYNQFKKDFSQIDRLPFSNIPRELQDLDPNLRYQARSRLKSDKGMILVGDRMAAISSPRPYMGWENFFPLIMRVIGQLNETTLVGQIERFSVKYMNVLEADEMQAQFSFVNLRAKLGTYDLTKHLTQFRTEIEERGFANIIEILAGTTVKTVDSKEFRGLLLNIDTVKKAPQNFWQEADALINSAHEVEKDLFFSVLSKSALDQFGPIWE